MVALTLRQLKLICVITDIDLLDSIANCKRLSREMLPRMPFLQASKARLPFAPLTNDNPSEWMT